MYDLQLFSTALFESAVDLSLDIKVDILGDAINASLVYASTRQAARLDNSCYYIHDSNFETILENHESLEFIKQKNGENVVVNKSRARDLEKDIEIIKKHYQSDLEPEVCAAFGRLLEYKCVYNEEKYNARGAVALYVYIEIKNKVYQKNLAGFGCGPHEDESKLLADATMTWGRCNEVLAGASVDIGDDTIATICRFDVEHKK